MTDNNRIKTRRKTTATASKPKAKAKPKAQPLDNMRIWEQVCETDPKFTKAVGFRGGFTSIDPQYQKRRMTELFGPCGIGWGGEATWVEVPRDEGNVVVRCTVHVWYRDETDTVRYLTPVTAKAMACDNGREDLDSDKKCFTDAFSKSTASLGLNADVFLGQFDDPSYVKQMEKKHDTPATEQQMTLVKQIVDGETDEFLSKVLNHFEIETIDVLLQSQAQRIIDSKTNKS